ncbi:transient receptor potential cation channel subfamily A member 1 homolog [Strongylocentrotus purpuratus]|uniref:PWWP domain-containing protein n=1 Tax=Strongylocentrotus purpuratus TaxID=7668 RepID=A0A7M7T2X7_STRPU|nr:transient receptor potential cation channel subfamily A member 1 homolog [Strongylocentrotus purpuratus]
MISKYTLDLCCLVTEPNWNWVAPIHEAVRVGHTDLVKKCLDEALKSEKRDETEKYILDNGVHDDRDNVLDLRGENDDSLLHIASSNGHVDVVERLVERGAKIDSTNWDLRTPLHLACIGNHRAVVEYLVEKKANLEKTDVDDLTPLQVAANAESFDVIIALLERHYNNNKNQTPLAIKDNYDTATIISEGGKSSIGYVEGNDLDAIAEEENETAVDAENDYRVDELNKNENEGSVADVTDHTNDGDNNENLEEIDETKSTKADSVGTNVEESLAGDFDEEGKVDPVNEPEEPTRPDNFDEKTSLAAFNVEPIPEPEAQPISEEKDESIAEFLDWVVTENKANVLKLFLRYRSKLNDVSDDDIKKYMSHAAKNGHTETVGVLIRWKPEFVNFYDDDGKTPLHHAAAHGHDVVVQELTKANASVNATTIDPVGAGYHHEMTAEIVTDNNGSSKKADERTALHFAAANGFAKPVRSLVKAGADINFPDKNGVTPLHLACIGGHLDAVKQLTEHDVDLLTRDHQGRNCMEFAADCGNENVAYFLLSHRDWKQIMSSSSWDEYHKDRSTPMEKLIEKMPDVAQAVMDKCIEISPYADRKDEEFWIEFYYEFLEDSFSLWENHIENKNNTNNNNDSTEDETALTETQSTPINEDAPQEEGTQQENETQPSDSQQDDDNHITDENHVDEENQVDENETSFTNKPEDEGTLNGGFKHGEGDVESQKPEALASYKEVQEEPEPMSNVTAYDDDGYLRSKMRPYSSNSARMVKNHPLIAMVKSERVDLLTHPLVISLLDHKWSSLGRYVFWPSLIIYFIFLVILTGYVTAVAPRYYAKMANETEIEWFGDGEQRWIKGIPQATLDFFAVNGHWVILILAVLHLVCELILLVVQRLSYFRLRKLVECSMYLLSILFVIPLAGQTEYQPSISLRMGWQWRCGSVAVCLAWINFIMFLRRFSFLGLYVLMFMDILRSFLKFILVLFCFLMAFALAFYMLLVNQPPFNRIELSLVKTMAMMLGDFDFVGIFHSQDYLGTENTLDVDEDDFFLTSVFYKAITYLMFTVFVAVMSIIVVNLLIGLAVYDVHEIRRKAKFYRLAMRVEAIMEVQQYLPVCIWRQVMRSKKRFFPNSGCCPRVRRGCSVLTGDRRVIKEAIMVCERTASEGGTFKERLPNDEFYTGMKQRLESIDGKMTTTSGRTGGEHPKRDEEIRSIRDRFDRMERKIDALLGRKKLKHEDEMTRDASK